MTDAPQDIHAVARTLVDNRAVAQCFVGDPGRGMTYFRR